MKRTVLITNFYCWQAHFPLLTALDLSGCAALTTGFSEMVQCTIFIRERIMDMANLVEAWLRLFNQCGSNVHIKSGSSKTQIEGFEACSVPSGLCSDNYLAMLNLLTFSDSFIQVSEDAVSTISTACRILEELSLASCLGVTMNASSQDSELPRLCSYEIQG